MAVLEVVYLSAKIHNFKQFTTNSCLISSLVLLFICPQRYIILSNSQLITKYKSISELNAELNDLTTNVGRYHIKWEWKESKTGHIVVCEKFGNGGIRIYDPQTGKQLKWGDILKRIDINKGVKILRVDDLMINEDIIDKIVKPKPKS